MCATRGRIDTVALIPMLEGEAADPGSAAAVPANERVRVTRCQGADAPVPSIVR